MNLKVKICLYLKTEGVSSLSSRANVANLGEETVDNF